MVAGRAGGSSSARPRRQGRRLALGVFSLNIHWSPSSREASHRYCQQAVRPLLEKMDADAGMRASVSACGWELEFLAEQHLGMFETLRRLVAENRIELLSCLYAPISWWMFPRVDLLRSVESNRRALAGLGLRPAPILLLPDGHFGVGMSALADHFDLALCHSKHWQSALGSVGLRPIYHLNGFPVALGCNSIWHEVAQGGKRRAPATALPEGPFFQAQALMDDALLADAPPEEVVSGQACGVEWYWYHFGGTHRWCSREPPNAWDSFYFDPAWAERCWGALESLRREGYKPSFVGDWWHALGTRARLDALPVLPESPLNAGSEAALEASRPLRQAALTAALGFGWRAGQSLRKCAEAGAGSQPQPAVESRLETARRCFQLSVLSPTSEVPMPGDILQFLRTNADRAASVTAELVHELRPQTFSGASSCKGGGEAVAPLESAPGACIEAVGADAAIAWFRVDDQTRVCLVRLKVEEEECGIRLAVGNEAVSYCPSGCEDRLQGIDLNRFKANEIVLPLANGLLGIGGAGFWIRRNRSTHALATLSKGQPWIWFTAANQPVGRILEWCFVLTTCKAASAIALANALNGTGFPGTGEGDSAAAALCDCVERLCR